ncbi:hypothetical protein DOTSEDRAFT_39935 [Dothistroma septosporum NZE10]|uniref:Uncharacterized protein n=1 Tax=Dothistroma septosporum (strain NZE10 / CBS 128990) TaxID=675120 RepID=N1Q1Y2_DOTSN|nr:hypothetical protein DOTSEDRAFT_39935 [Dothistroma septosporum NZE10]
MPPGCRCDRSNVETKGRLMDATRGPLLSIGNDVKDCALFVDQLKLSSLIVQG